MIIRGDLGTTKKIALPQKKVTKIWRSKVTHLPVSHPTHHPGSAQNPNTFTLLVQVLIKGGHITLPGPGILGDS